MRGGQNEKPMGDPSGQDGRTLKDAAAASHGGGKRATCGVAEIRIDAGTVQARDFWRSCPPVKFLQQKRGTAWVKNAE